MKKLLLFGVIYCALSISGCKKDSNAPPVMTKGYYNPDSLNTGLPVIRINTLGNQKITSKEEYLSADIIISDPANSANDIETTTEIRGRGNSTWTHPKKPYRLKFFEKKSLFGLQKAKSWVLLANYQDPTLMMNSVAFELGKRMGLPFTNHYIHVELVLNGVYEGSYVLTEQVQVGEGRVDIDENEGWFVELDDYYDEEPKFKTSLFHLPVMIKSPEDLALSAYDFVKNDINELENAMFAPDFPESGYRDLINSDAFVDFILINEIVGNLELIHPKSVYMYKDIDEKIGLGPLWDFDWAFGYAGSGHLYFTETMYRSEKHPFFQRFFDDPEFRSRYKEHWNEKYAEISSIESFISEMGVSLNVSQKANYAVWQWIDGVNYEQEIINMRAWWNARIQYLNTEISKY